MPFNDETAPSGTHPALAMMIDRPVLAILPFLGLLIAGMETNVALLFTPAFL